MHECCFVGSCFKNFKDFPEQIGELRGVAMLEGYIHQSGDGQMISKVPLSNPWNEFLFDYWDYYYQVDFENNFTTLVEINILGQKKIYCNWCDLDRYKGHYEHHNLTRHMVDVNIHIPGQNLKLQHHFCY